MPVVNFQRDDRLGEIVIDNPPQNLFGGGLLTDLRDSVNAAAASDVRAVLLRAEGDDFSAGADVSIFSDIGKAEATELAATALALIGASANGRPHPWPVLRGCTRGLPCVRPDLGGRGQPDRTD